MKLLLILLPLFLSSLVLAEDTLPPPVELKEYDIEIIIFEDVHSRYLNSQSWEQSSAKSKMPVSSVEPIENLDEMSLSEIIATDFKTRSPSILEKDYKRLNASSEYEVLFYGAWRQAGLNKKKAFEINIKELDNEHKSVSDNEISGSFKLILARYLHLYNKLNYQRTTQTQISAPETAENIQTEIVESRSTFVLNSHRRMRSKELHYIDHPLVGLLVQINPVKKHLE